MMFHGRIDKDVRYEYTLFMLIIAPIVFMTVRLGVVHFSPHALASAHVNNVSHTLLDCLADYMPDTSDTQIMKDCVSSIDIYNVSKSRMPFTIQPPIAFVMPYVYKKRVFVMRDMYYMMDTVQQALILIHECTHLVLNTRDYAYRWQSEFYMLTKSEHANNADSYVDAIVRQCFRASPA